MSSTEEFRAVYEAHFDFVWRSLRRLGVREADVLDVTQRVFLTVYVKLPEFEGRSRLTSWLFAICRHLASDYRRSAPVRREIFAVHGDLDKLLSRDALNEGDASAACAELAQTLLDRLPEAQREVFVLFELEELSGEAIAELLEIPVGTVRSRLRLAREALAEHVRRFKAEGMSIQEAI